MSEPILDPGRQAGMCVHDGSVWRKAKGDAAGHQQVDVLSSALPSGAATESTLSSILTELGEKLETTDLAIDTENHLDTHKIPHSSEVKLHGVWSLTVPAGETKEMLPTTSGCGKVFACMFRIDGQAYQARTSQVCFYIDEEATPSTIISPDHIYWYLCGNRVVDLSLAGIVTWDTVNHIYHGWWAFGPRFESSVRVVIKNLDTANPIVVRVGIWIEWLK